MAGIVVEDCPEASERLGLVPHLLHVRGDQDACVYDFEPSGQFGERIDSHL